MRVEFLRDWRWFKRGQVAEFDKGRGDLLCRLGMATEATAANPEPPAVEAKPKPKRKRARRKKSI